MAVEWVLDTSGKRVQGKIDDHRLNESAGRLEHSTKLMLKDATVGDASFQTKLAALKNFTPGVPQVGDTHPQMPELRVYSRDFRMIDPVHCEVTVGYRTPTSADALVGEMVSFETSASVQSVSTNVDRDGNLLTVRNPLTGKDQGGSVTIRVPIINIRASVIWDTLPVALYDDVGTINSQQVNIGGIFWSQETTMFTGLSTSLYRGIQEDNAGRLYQWNFEFEHSPRGIGNTRIVGGNADPYDAVVVATDDSTGKPFDIAQVADGSIGVFEMYDAVSWPTGTWGIDKG